MSRRNTKKTTEEFKKEVFDLVGDAYEVLGEYVTKDTKISLRHNLCGLEYEVTPHNFLSGGTRCPECGMKNRHLNNTKTFKYYLNKLKEKGILNQIEILDKIDENDRTHNENTSITFKILKTNVIRTLTIRRLLRLEAEDISNSNFILTEDDFKRNILKRNSNLEFLSGYKGNKEKIKVRCAICGYKIERIANNLMTNPSCPNCNKIKKKKEKNSEEALLKRLNQTRVDVDEYEIDLSSYETNRTKLKFKHKKCGTEFLLDFHGFASSKHGCPFCRMSYYEKYIEKSLNKYDLKYETQKKYDDCKNIIPLPFDFLIDNEILLEYDGRQHYLPIYGEKHFIETKRNDQIKNNFCKENNIPLIRIPYYLYKKIDNILEMIKNNNSISEICDYIELQGSTTIPEEVVKFHNRSRAQDSE